MKKKKHIIFVIILFFVMMITTKKVFASDFINKIKIPEYTEDYKKWLQLSEEEKENVLEPRMYEIPRTSVKYKNPLKFTRMLGVSYEPNFSLRSYIPKNVVVRDQMNTDTCWAFGAISSLETNLALKNYYNGIEEIEYDFSERHMDYATTREFANGINKFGFNRNAGGLGNFYFSLTYLTNGMGAIKEEDMRFENNSNKINIEEIQNKKVVTTVYDTINYPSYKITDDLTKIKEQMKYHIKNYGSIEAGICGSLNDEFYNNATGAIYYSDDNNYQMNHVVSIIGWDDNYPIDNFSQSNKPQHAGAWIIKNSGGTIRSQISIAEVKGIYFKDNTQDCINRGWNSASDIPNEFIQEVISSTRYRIEGDMVVEPLGNDGIMYVSYEDVNIYKYLHGITKASDKLDYENIYQYNEIINEGAVKFDNTPKLYLANIFEKKTEKDEYLNMVSIYAPGEYEKCKVYVNSNGDSLKSESLKPVALKAGEFETMQDGYHTLEFANPVKINSDKFVVVVEIENDVQKSVMFALETNIPGENNQYDDYVTIESGKCFISEDANEWLDLSKMSQAESRLPDGDSTIKAFTISSVPDISLDKIEVTKEPTVTYVEGDSLSKSQIEVTAYYKDGSSKVIENYTIENGTNLKRGENQVTIKYTEEQDNKEAQTSLIITAEENSITGIYVDTQPTNKTYTVGDEFNPAGMVIKARYKRGEPVILLNTEYIIVDGESLTLNQSTVTIKYKHNEAITTQVEGITVNPPNPNITKIEITELPSKTAYYEGERFDSSGMQVDAVYDNDTRVNITNYCTIQDLGILSTEDTSVEISYQGHKAYLQITVNPNLIKEIKVATEPKTEYEEGEIFNPDGMVVVAVYEYGEPVDITSQCTIENIGILNENTTITITYKENYTTTLDITVNKKEVKPAQNSKFDNIKLNIKSGKVYFYTDTSKENYGILNVEIKDIEKTEGNDNYEYYYYLSPNISEKSIKSWIKIPKGKIENGKLYLSIDTRDIENYEEISDADTLYLYLREVVTKGEEQSIIITNPLKFEPDDNLFIEVYINDEKFDDTNLDPKEPEKNDEKKKEDDNDDDTIIDRAFPNAGSKIIFAGILAISTLSIIRFIKYRKLKEIR